MKKLWIAAALGAALALAGCASAQVNVAIPTGPIEPIKTVALSPTGGAFADAIGFQLLSKGFSIYNTSQVSNLMVRLNLTEVEVERPQNLARFKQEGIDAYMQVRILGGDQTPQGAAVSLVSTSTGKLLVGATWVNGHGCAPGSPCDAMFKTDIMGGSKQIADAIAKAVPQQ